MVVEQDDDSKCESSEEPSKADGSEALPKAVITEEAINYKGMNLRYCFCIALQEELILI